MRLLFPIICFLLIACTNSSSNLEEAATVSSEPADTIRANMPPLIDSTSNTAVTTCETSAIFEINGTSIYQIESEENILFIAGMTIDADGSPRAYHPDEDKGLDNLGNAGTDGNWWALVTDDNGNPVIQTQDDPAPGFYISTTSLFDRTKNLNDPDRYVNSEEIPFFVLPPQFTENTTIQIGDLGVIYNTHNETLTYGIYADTGPRDHIGEGSITLANELNIDSDARTGGTDNDLYYLVFPNSGDRTPKSANSIFNEGRRLFTEWGGLDRLLQCRE